MDRAQRNLEHVDGVVLARAHVVDRVDLGGVLPVNASCREITTRIREVAAPRLAPVERSVQNGASRPAKRKQNGAYPKVDAVRLSESWNVQSFSSCSM